VGNELSWKAVGHSKKFRLSFVDLPSFPNWLLVFTRSLKPNELTIIYEKVKHLANCANVLLKLCCFCPYFYKRITLEKCKSLFSPPLLCPTMLRFTRPVNMLEREEKRQSYGSGRIFFSFIKRQFLTTLLFVGRIFFPSSICSRPLDFTSQQESSMVFKP
jgi:hypothetical protein